MCVVAVAASGAGVTIIVIAAVGKKRRTHIRFDANPGSTLFGCWRTVEKPNGGGLARTDAGRHIVDGRRMTLPGFLVEQVQRYGVS
jgi:hypothetical protein